MRMIQRRYLLLVSIAALLFVSSGCASMSKNKKTDDLEKNVSNLQERLSKVEKNQNQLEQIVAQQIQIQRDMVNKVESVKKTEATKINIDNISDRDIQLALKNAGLYSGEIDGKIGPKTRDAIMEFQKQNGLKVDGTVGKNTWELLSKYYTPEEKK